MINKTRAHFVAHQLDSKIINRVTQDFSAKPLLQLQTLEVINRFSDATVSKYIVKVMQWYTQGDFLFEDLYKVNSALILFASIRNRLAKQDIMQYKHFIELQNALDAYNIPTVDSNDIHSERFITGLSLGSYKMMYNTPKFKVIVPLTREAAIHFGKGTTWCTADEQHNAWDTYKNGVLYIIYAEDQMFQLHYERAQFMNSKDYDLSQQEIEFLSTIPEYKEFLEYLVELHYN
jgi:hypothetical protein